MKKTAILLILGLLLTVSCTEKGQEFIEQELPISDVSFTPCQQNKPSLQSVTKSDVLSDKKVDVKFTGKGVQITYYNFEVTCDFTDVSVTHTFVNGFLNITQQGTPNQAKCVCYTDVSYTINGISQNEVNVIFINGEQVYCYNDNIGDDCYIEDGIYTGTFTVRYSGGSTSGMTTVELKDGKFICIGNSNRIPAGGSGNYLVKSNCKIVFEDVNIWTANFDWGLILNGEYDYTFDGENLKFSRGIYEYDLKKVGETFNCDKDVIISQTEYENAPNAPVSIIDMKIVDNCLKIKFAASGCSGNTWNVKLIGLGNYDKSNPPQTALRLSLDNNEICAAVITKEVSFSLEPLIEYFRHHGTNNLYLNISGKQILYEY